VTLHGPGGIGKSRLALEVARALEPSFRDGVYFVPLASVTDPERLAATLAQALGLKESSGEDTLVQLLNRLQDRDALLLLDNFEQLTEAAPLVSQLLSHAPRLKVLVTSRAVLHLSGEHEVDVPPLSLPPGDELQALEASEAVRLFVARAKAVQPTFELTATNAATIAELCQRLDGLPLAIELAAAHLRMLPPEALLARLKQRLPMLSLAARDLPERQQTLTRTLDWSYNLLARDEREVFAALAVFVGGADLAAAETLCADAVPVPLETLLALADKSLVQLQQSAEGATRVTMLRTVREYALDKLAASGQEARLREQHAAYFLALAEAAVPALTGPDQRRWLARLRLELDNVRAAMTHLLETKSAAPSLRLATALRWYCMMSGNFSEGRGWLKAALALPGEVEPSVRAAALTGAGALAWRQGDLAEARPLLEESLALQRTIGDKRGEAATLRNLGLLEHNEGDYPAAKAFHEASLEVMRALEDAEGVANALLSLGNVALDQGDARASHYYRQSLEIAEGIGDELGAAYALDNLGVAAWHFGDLAEAERLTATCEERYRALEHQLGLANVAHRFGLIAYQKGRYDEAREHFAASLEVKEALGDGRGRAFLLFDLGKVALRQGAHGEAAAFWSQGLELTRKLGMRTIAILFVEGSAELAHTCGRTELAARLFATAAAFRKHAGVPIAPVNLPHYQHVVAAVRHALSAGAYAEATRRENVLAFEQGVDEALELTRGFAALPAV
jgi:predicted ATPase